jgi:hypothetical protein
MGKVVGFRVSGFGFWVSSFGFWVSSFGFRVSGFGGWVRGGIHVSVGRSPEPKYSSVWFRRKREGSYTSASELSSLGSLSRSSSSPYWRMPLEAAYEAAYVRAVAHTCFEVEGLGLQGYLAHKKPRPTRTLPYAYA